MVDVGDSGGVGGLLDSAEDDSVDVGENNNGRQCSGLLDGAED